MTTKTLEDARLKASATVGTRFRTLDFYACTFSKTPDKNGDIIDPRALDVWLKDFYAAGRPLPISFAHAAVLESTDPFAIIGAAPADPDHVWVDDFGLRVKAQLDVETNSTARQVASLIDQGIITGASIAFVVTNEAPDPETKAQRILGMTVKEAGPCLAPANEEAVLLALKQVRDQLRAGEDVETKAVDESAWDGNKAMGQCSTAAQYRSICAGERSVGDADERQHWALPHHYLGQGPNANGVRNALARAGQTQGLKNAGSARSHLEAHMSSISPDSSATEDVQVETDILAFDVKHMKSPAHLQSAHDALVRAGAKCSTVGDIHKTDDDEPQSALEQELPEPGTGDPEVDGTLRRLKFMEISQL